MREKSEEMQYFKLYRKQTGMKRTIVANQNNSEIVQRISVKLLAFLASWLQIKIIMYFFFKDFLRFNEIWQIQRLILLPNNCTVIKLTFFFVSVVSQVNMDKSPYVF